MQACTTELYITSICHQIIIHECYLNDQVLANVNICFSPNLNHGCISKFAAINLFCLFWYNLQVILDGLSYIGPKLTHDN